MWRFLRLRILRVGMPALALLPALQGVPARADLTFAQPLATVGQVRSGTALSHTFHFENPGPGAIEVTEVRGSCGCLTPILEKRVFQPGETGDLLLEVNTLSQSAGGHHWRVFFSYAGGGRLFQRRHAAATVITEVRSAGGAHAVRRELHHS